jgi:transcriptional regulator with XRE-family HTH domain
MSAARKRSASIGVDRQHMSSTARDDRAEVPINQRDDEWAATTCVSSLSVLGNAIYWRRRARGLRQTTVADATGVEPRVVSLLERGCDDTIPFQYVLRVVDLLELDIELRPRGSKFTPRPPTKVNELGLSPAALAALDEAGIQAIDQLGSASALIERAEFSSGVELFEVVCALNRHGLSLPIDRHGRIPGDREREIFRLRSVEGLSLREIGRRFNLHPARIRQILGAFFGLSGIPPAARRGKRG